MNQNDLPPLPLVGDTLFVDNSGWLEGLMTCPRALRYKQLDRRIPVAESAALNFGSAIHFALEYRYRHYQSSPVDVFYQDGITPILTEHFDAHPAPMDDWRTLNWALELVNKYNERYGQEEFSLLRYKEPHPCPQCLGSSGADMNKDRQCLWCNGTGKTDVMVELPFALPLFETTHEGKPLKVIYTGKIDLPIILDNQTWVLDHKTTGMLGNSFFDDMRMSSQQKGYAWAFSQLTGEKVTGYIINAVRSKEMPLYVAEGKERKGREGKTLSPAKWWQETFQREKYRLRADDLVEWKNNCIDILEEFLWNYSRGKAPMKTKWCSQYGRCPYYDVCSMEASDRGVYLASGLFTDNNWSPLKTPSQSKQ